MGAILMQYGKTISCHSEIFNGAVTKLQRSRHFRQMGSLQQFHLVSKYKKGIDNKVYDMISRPIISATTLLKHNFFSMKVMFNNMHTLKMYT